MQWYSNLAVIIFVVFVGGVKGILAFSFCAVVSFIFVRNLFDGQNGLDFTSYFASKGLGTAKETVQDASTTTKSFPTELKACRRTLIRNILRDFVISWYEKVGIGGDFVLETKALLEEATVSFFSNIAHSSISSPTEKLSILLHRHLVAATTAKQNHRNQNFVEFYLSLQNKRRSYQTSELQYLQSVVDLLLYRLVAPKTLGCDPGRLILREILAMKLMLPIVDKISDPDFVNTSIINIFGESKDENLLINSLASDKTSESNLKVLTPLLEYLEENLELDSTSNDKGKLFMSEFTKYEFTNTTVIEKDHTEIVELSIEANSQDIIETLNSVGRDGESTHLKTNLQTMCKPRKNSADKKPEINGITKSRNYKPCREREHSTFKAILSAKIHPSGMSFARNFRRIQSSPIIKPSTAPNLGEPQQTVSEQASDGKGFSDLSKESVDELSLESDGKSTSDPKESCGESISRPLKTELLSSSFEEIDVPNCSSAVMIDSPGSWDSTKTTRPEKGFENLSSNEKAKLCRTSSGPPRSRHHTTSFSSADEWDTEMFEHESLFEDFLGTDTQEDVSLQPGLIADDNVSLANIAIHEVPNPCSMISIPSTELVTDHSFEPYKSRYTVYVIVYNTQLWPHNNDDDPENEKSEAGTQGSIKRRYREFMELHHRLLIGSLASFMKDIPKPNRKFNSPFFRLDQGVIQGRQHLLENYLKCLVTKPNILNCDDFKGFLGIGDESHTDFRRYVMPNVPLPNVPRIDKKLQKKVTKFIDHIKTAFDTGPVYGDKEEEYEDIRQVLGEDKSQDEIRDFAIYSQGCKLNHNYCYSENCFQSFIQHHHKENEVQTTECASEVKEKVTLNIEGSCKQNGYASRVGKHFQNQFHWKVPVKESLMSNNSVSPTFRGQENNPLTKTVLNLSCELMEKQKSWVCLEPVQQAATAVFGCFLEWWMESQLSELVTEEQWRYYLTLLTETVWPGGELMKSSEQEKTEEEKLKTKEEAIQTLTEFFGAVLHTAFGRETMECCAREIVGSFQNAEINRQVLFEALEVILAEIFPDLARSREAYLSSRNC